MEGNGKVERIHADLGEIMFQLIVNEERGEHLVGQLGVRGDRRKSFEGDMGKERGYVEAPVGGKSLQDGF
jgi:hypothetical protein